ncbi:acetyl-CoA synthetase-like protein [Pseudovirgaria hyperparasitica]|uniref:Acetyl-CoA synthetase-like protein n=1 Tax=Pseudovirgaria hyperparasitica TaxID=470096 RepID=A0A6A6WI70_9PEZI|nr:acetyl-CoA synthetase-like protein [Pseudovirgaria hyperparasitica]KAF2761686.1 acetyl-CoA synthetase-like protein [Pseudovirgaria hyperparasitica]
MIPSYFTCTLSEALAHNRGNYEVRIRQTPEGLVSEHAQFNNIDEFVSFLAQNYGGHLAVGCVTPDKTSGHSQDGLVEELLTFAEVDEQTCRLSQHFRHVFGQNQQGKQCIALIASSSIVFLLTWLAFIRSGYEVLLVSPQNSPEAILHLIKLSRSFAICFDREHAGVVSEALCHRPKDSSNSEHHDSDDRTREGVKQFELPWPSLDSVCRSELHTAGKKTANQSEPPESIAFYRHSSGTTGLPKLIPSTHHGAVGVLPRLQGCGDIDQRSSTFTTTPLYSGGIADLLRSWSAASPLWIFPERTMPITSQIISSCIDGIDRIAETHPRFPATKLQFLSCVPFVLETIVESTALKDRLRRLSAVGVGGAAMPRELGDKIVAEGINLVSRFGSSECGFLLSSQRDYANDKRWHVLRCRNSEGLNFQRMADGRHELIVEENWPLVSVAAHARRPFNTHDVFIPHEGIDGAWNYIGRSDAQLTLSTGKKFDPTPIEQALRRIEIIEDAIVIGDDRPFPAAIIFMAASQDKIKDVDAHENIWHHIQQVNMSSPSHAKLEKTNLCILSFSAHSRVRKNSKGGVIRSGFIAEFSSEINRIYNSDHEDDGADCLTGDPANMREKIKHLVCSALHQSDNFSPDQDLFEAGMDSAKSIVIRKQICGMLPARIRPLVPLSVVYECGSINALVNFVLERTGKTGSMDANQTTKDDEMRAMVDQYMALQPQLLEHAAKHTHTTAEASQPGKAKVILTGSTGFLGTHILHHLLTDPSISNIFLLIRDSSANPHSKQTTTAQSRVEAALNIHHLAQTLPKSALDKITYIPFHLKHPLLGLSPETYASLVSQTTHVIHAAWDVNFTLPLKSFAPQLEGVVNLHTLLLLGAAQSHPSLPPKRLIFCSSVASIARASANTKQDHSISAHPHDAADLGYAQSKWVAERVLDSLSRNSSAAVAVSVLRVGQLSGASTTGIWNAREAWPLMLSAGLKLKLDLCSDDSGQDNITLPDLASAHLKAVDWLPVDVAARRVVAEMHSLPQPASQSAITITPISNTNPATHTPWSHIQTWITQWAASRKHPQQTQFIPPHIWLARLDAAPGDHQAKALIPLWRGNWVGGRGGGGDGTAVPDEQSSDGIDKIDLTDSEECGMISRAYIGRVLDWVARQEE